MYFLNNVENVVHNFIVSPIFVDTHSFSVIAVRVQRMYRENRKIIQPKCHPNSTSTVLEKNPNILCNFTTMKQTKQTVAYIMIGKL